MEDTHRTIEAVWRIESARVIAGLARLVGDVGLAEDLAQDALLAALEQWPESGVPDNPGAWLMTTGRRRAIDMLRRRTLLQRKQEQLGYEIEAQLERAIPDLDAELDDDIGDERLRLVFTCCHPVLSTEARVPFEVPRAAELRERLASVLEVIYLVFNEGYAATAGDDWLRAVLWDNGARLLRVES